MFRPCNRAIVRLFNRDHRIDYIIRGVFGVGGGGVERDLAYIVFRMLLYITLSILLHIIIMTM